MLVIFYINSVRSLRIASVLLRKTFRRSPQIVQREKLEQSLNATRQKAVDWMKERCYCLTLSNTKRYRQQTARRKEKMETLLGIRNTQQ